MLKHLLAGFAGLFAAFFIVGLTEFAGSFLNAPPPGFDPNDVGALNKYIATLPPSAFALVLAGWVLAAFCGPFLAARIAPNRGPASAVAVLFGIACILNMVGIPHPLPFMVAAVLLVPAASVAGIMFARRGTAMPGATGV